MARVSLPTDTALELVRKGPCSIARDYLDDAPNYSDIGPKMCPFCELAQLLKGRVT